MVEWKFVVEVVVIIATIVVILFFFISNWQSITQQFLSFLEKTLGWVFR